MATPEHLGKYEIHKQLGRGAFATVYQVLDTTLNREVALKILHPQLLTDPTFVGRFKREAQATATLDHPHIATIYEIGEAEERVYISFYLAHGPDLSEALRGQGRFTWERTLAVLQPLCEALDYAHGKGLVHRDLKPSNILLDSERGPLLTDFGFARLMGDSSVSLSLSGGILGTPAYIAPEVWEMDTAEPPADIYAMGCILYEMLTGEVLFAGKTPIQALRAHDCGPQFPETWPEDVPADIETVLNKALARDPAARYPSGNAFWHALHDLDAQAQAAQEAAEQAAVTAQWREETKAAMAEGEWCTAKMTVGRWLAIAPDDSKAKAAQSEIAQQLERTTPKKATSESEATGEAPSSAPSPAGRTPSAPSRKKVSWSWIAGGIAGVLLIGCVVLVLVLSGVLSDNGAIGGMFTADSRPTTEVERTPTRLSESQPLQNATDLGTQENPIVWGFVPLGDTQTALKAFLELTDLLADETGRYFEVLVADEYTDIVEHMCATPIEVHMGSLNTLSYLLVNDRCDVEAELVGVRYGSSTYNGQIIANVNSGIQSLGDLDGATFCRPDSLSTSGWVIPMLTIRANGINPYEDLELVDAGSHDAVVTAVYNGDCDAGATYVDARGAVEGNTPDVMDRVPVIATTVDVPNGGVQFASSIDDNLKDEIVKGLLAISDTEEGQEALDTVFYWTDLEKRGDGFYDSFRQVLQRSGMTIENLVY